MTYENYKQIMDRSTTGKEWVSIVTKYASSLEISGNKIIGDDWKRVGVWIFNEGKEKTETDCVYQSGGEDKYRSWNKTLNSEKRVEDMLKEIMYCSKYLEVKSKKRTRKLIVPLNCSASIIPVLL